MDGQMDVPRFSFIMPAYNAASVIGHAIESVQKQTFLDWELVVTDDGSTDATAAVVGAYRINDPRIKLISQKNAGCGAARDTSAQNAIGRYLVRFDADDELMPNYLERMDSAILTYPGHDIYCCNGITRLPDGTTALARKGELYETPQNFKLEDMFEFVHIFTIALFSSEIYHKVGHIDPHVYCEDVSFWFDAFLHGATCQYIPEKLAYYTVSDTQMTSDFAQVGNSCIGIYRSLIEGGRLTKEQVALAEKAIERTCNDLAIFQKRNALVKRIDKVFGPHVGKVVSALIHGVGKAVRPLYAKVLSSKRAQGESRGR